MRHIASSKLSSWLLCSILAGSAIAQENLQIDAEQLKTPERAAKLLQTDQTGAYTWMISTSLNPVVWSDLDIVRGDMTELILSNGVSGIYLRARRSDAEDSDSDGMPNVWELFRGLRPNKNDAEGDLDADGLSNIGEYELGSRPDRMDSFGLGLEDNLLVGRMNGLSLSEPLGWWPLDEGSGTVAHDQSMLENNATLQGGGRWALPLGVQFSDGATLEIPPHPAYVSLNAFTISLTLRVEAAKPEAERSSVCWMQRETSSEHSNAPQPRPFNGALEQP